ncbi:MAG: MBL fold metallo-hydrolase [Actinomycetota bacterium]
MGNHQHLEAIGPSAGNLQELAKGVYAWIQPDGSWWINNAGLISDGGSSFIVDTCATAERTQRFLDAAERACPDAPIRYALNTHEHGDHTYGNILLPAAAELIGHPVMVEHLAQDFVIDGCPPIWEPVPHWGVSARRLPDSTVASSGQRDVGDIRVEIMHPGYAAHTQGDLVAWLPEAEVLFSGDLLFHGLTPLVFAGSITGARRALQWIAEMEPLIVVPGHGPLVSRENLSSVLAEHEEYFSLVQATAERGLSDGLSVLQAADACALGRFADWADQERLVLNLHRAYADSLGTQLDVLTAFSDAMTFNGGALTTHVCCAD